jgi:hypothetical protein
MSRSQITGTGTLEGLSANVVTVCGEFRAHHAIADASNWADSFTAICLGVRPFFRAVARSARECRVSDFWVSYRLPGREFFSPRGHGNLSRANNRPQNPATSDCMEQFFIQESQAAISKLVRAKIQLSNNWPSSRAMLIQIQVQRMLRGE